MNLKGSIVLICLKMDIQKKFKTLQFQKTNLKV